MSSTPPLTPRQAYDQARSLEMTKHKYTTEGIHAVCSCTYVGTTESIAGHVEGLAEAAGVGARDREVARIAKEYEENEQAKRRRKEADLARAREEIKQQESAQ